MYRSEDGGATWKHSTCGLTTADELYCWGYNEYGRLGNGTDGNYYSRPELVTGEHTWASVELGYDNTCGVTTAGKAYCWGRNAFGEIGDGTTTTRYVPTKVGGNW